MDMTMAAPYLPANSRWAFWAHPDSDGSLVYICVSSYMRSYPRRSGACRSTDPTPSAIDAVVAAVFHGLSRPDRKPPPRRQSDQAPPVRYVAGSVTTSQLRVPTYDLLETKTQPALMSSHRQARTGWLSQETAGWSPIRTGVQKSHLALQSERGLIRYR